MDCKPCGKTFSGIVSYNQHMESEKHKRKIISLNMLQTMQNNLSNQPLASEVTSASISTQEMIKCSVCNLSFNSFDDFKNHTLSLEHANEVRNSEAANIKAMFCSICDILFDSLQNYISHSESLEHATNVSKKFQNNANNCSFEVSSTTSNDSSSKISTGLSGVETDTVLPPIPSYGASYLTSFADCQVCGKQFSGPEPYKQHMVSAAHKKKMDMQKYAAPGTGGSQKFTCEPCNKEFSGHIPYQQHLASDVHRKKLQSIQLLGEWGGKEIISNSVVGDPPDGINPRTEGNRLNDIVVNHPWFCNICLVPCSGHIPYQQHLQGENHWKNVRKAELLKSKTDTTLGNISTPLLSSSNNINTVSLQPILQTDNNNIQNIQTEVTVHNMQTINNAIQNMEVDTILPLAMQNLTVVSADELNLKEFLPEDSIDFDKCENNGTENTTNTENVSQESSTENIEEGNVEVYKKCTCCNVELKSRDDALSHYESSEHFNKRWHSN